MKLDDKGRCCGRKPIFYSSWRSPLMAPLHFCCDCCREYGPDGQQRQNWAWKEVSPGEFQRIKSKVIA